MIEIKQLNMQKSGHYQEIQNTITLIMLEEIVQVLYLNAYLQVQCYELHKRYRMVLYKRKQ